MKWYNGGIADAVNYSKSKGSIFVVFIEGADDVSKKLAELFENGDLGRLLQEDKFVAIKIEGGSTAHGQFEEIFKGSSVPCVYFIGKSGRPLDIITGKDDLDNLSERIDKILLKAVSVSPNTKVSAAAASHDFLQNERSAASSKPTNETGNGDVETSKTANPAESAATVKEEPISEEGKDKSSEENSDNITEDVKTEVNDEKKEVVPDNKETVPEEKVETVPEENKETKPEEVQENVPGQTKDTNTTSEKNKDATPEKCGEATSQENSDAPSQENGDTSSQKDIEAVPQKDNDNATESDESTPKQSKDTTPKTSNNSTPKNSSPAPNTGNVNEAKDLSPEEKLQRARELVELKRQQKEKEEEENERLKEIERRKMGQNVQQMKRLHQETELKQLKEEREREKRENQQAKERILAQIAQDRAEQSARLRNSPPPVPEPSKNVAQSPPKVPSDTTRLQFKLPNGFSITKEFKNTDLLEKVVLYVREHISQHYKNFTLSTMFPRREFTQDDFSQSLVDLELTPTAVILVIPTATSLAQNENGGFFYALLWGLLTPVYTIYDYLKNLIFGSSNNPQKRPPSDDAGETSRNPKRSKEISAVKRQGNIHRLTDNNDSDDENNTWNGNSTQQM